jgi:D-threo-aldose 1-dehydrogenase
VTVNPGPCKSGPLVSGPLIFGGAPIGGLYAPVSDKAAAGTVAAAWEAGIRAFDTAPHYGVGVSERRLGSFLAGRPGTSSPCAPRWAGGWCPPPGTSRARRDFTTYRR